MGAKEKKMDFDKTLETYGWAGVIEPILTAIKYKGTDLARLFRVSPVTVSRWRRNHVEPRGKHRDKLDLLYIKFVEKKGVS